MSKLERMASARSAILDSAYDMVVAHGWGAARMADVAARAGVSRQTLYNEFGSKEGLARAVLLRESARFLDGVAALLDEHHEDPLRAVEAAAFFTLTEAADNPLLKAVLTASGDEDLLPLVTTRSEYLVVAARGMIADSLRRHWPALDATEVSLVAETAVRLTVSHLLLPTERPDVIARHLARLVTSYLSASAHTEDT